MNTLTLKVPEAIQTLLKSVAKKQGKSKSDIVRQALMEYLSKDTITASSSILDQAEDLAGTIKAPSDLSSNKKHLEGYGS